MHEQHKIEHLLKEEAKKISSKFNDAPVIVIVAGDSKAGTPRVITGSTVTGRLRDLLGILQTAIQIETLKHFGSRL
ncbi:hypothetical protein KKC44_04300 [Patescibacteria group bacterium]|nr:hypothetical protein [Patescibacteria group bacterium]MBU2259799.1 hypothetical protein [Patescibacteria group bacterium]